MNCKFYMLWVMPDGTRGWTGPHGEIDDAKAHVSGDVVTLMIAVPIRDMTPGERREALPILEGR